MATAATPPSRSNSPPLDSPEKGKFERLVQRIEPGSKLLRAWPLTGGVSAQVTALEIERPGGRTEKLIARRHGDVDFSRNPAIAADEYRLLNALHSAGIPTPAPRYVDDSGEIFSRPCLVVEYIEGEPEFEPADLDDFIQQLATHLAAIHRLNVSNPNLPTLPDQEALYTEKLRARPERLDDSLDEGRIRDTLESVWPLPRRNRSALLHGDYWPGNTLWRDGRLVGIIDWEDAALGDPLADLANTRLEILWALGIDVMHDFTRHYRSMMETLDFAHLPYWELCAALRPASKLSKWGLDSDTEQAMRAGHRAFVTRAYRGLAEQA